ncbi:MAG: enoyl-CoA hydratase-related protein [Caulobacter sp.]|nr:enoyl-CoA hydratase-related protein [Caulobacter sp.]
MVLSITDQGRSRVLTFNRPDQLNAMNDALYDAITEALTAAATDAGVSAVVLTGAGRAFCAGQDLAEMANRPTYPAGERHGFGPFIETLEAFPKPLCAAVNGLGVGIGLTLLPYCDKVIMAPTARLRAPFVSLGVTAEAGSTLLLPALIGWPAAADILLTGRWVSAANAVEIGLAQEIAPEGGLLDRAQAWADQFRDLPVASLIATRSLMIAARVDAGAAARHREDHLFRKLAGGPANLEALAAFREKRPADFGAM